MDNSDSESENGPPIEVALCVKYLDTYTKINRTCSRIDEQIVFYIICDDKLQKLLRFEPHKLVQVWRYLTYMLIHDDLLHLLLNVTMQLLFAYFLESRHGKIRILAIYAIGGITGVLGASCLRPELVVGASGGVYALLTSHVSDILLNFQDMKHKIYRSICIVVIVISDVTYNLVHVLPRAEEPLISWGAHVMGGVSGLLLGLVFLKGTNGDLGGMRKRFFWLGAVLYVILLISIVILSVQIRKCTNFGTVLDRYIYFC